MMKKLRAFVIILILLSLAVSLCGCKSKEKNPDSTAAAVQESSGIGKPASEPEHQPEEETPPTAREIAASMQDYSHAPGEKAAPIETVDENYLILANKTHPLGKDYWPEDLVTVSKFVAGVGNDDTHKMRKIAAEALEEMFRAAEADGIDIRLRTGFRSYSYQSSLFNSYVQKNGEAKANTFSARPGESEHQTGLACDLGGKSEGYALSYSFGETPEGKWVAQHAHEYGFFIRFTDGKTVNGVRMPGEITGYVFEPWHIRYVGKDVAAEIYEQNITFEEYLGVID